MEDEDLVPEKGGRKPPFAFSDLLPPLAAAA